MRVLVGKYKPDGMCESLMTLPQVTTLKSPAFRRISIGEMKKLGISLTDNADPLEAETRVNAQKAESKLKISTLRCITVQESVQKDRRCARLSNLSLGGLPALPAQKRLSSWGMGDEACCAHDAATHELELMYVCVVVCATLDVTAMSRKQAKRT